jgi:hypothetical protein
MVKGYAFPVCSASCGFLGHVAPTLDSWDAPHQLQIPGTCRTNFRFLGRAAPTLDSQDAPHQLLVGRRSTLCSPIAQADKPGSELAAPSIDRAAPPLTDAEVMRVCSQTAAALDRCEAEGGRCVCRYIPAVTAPAQPGADGRPLPGAELRGIRHRGTPRGLQWALVKIWRWPVCR